MDLFLQFVTENDIDSVDRFKEYSSIHVLCASDGSISYATEKEKGRHSSFSFLFDIDDYIGWDELALDKTI